MLKSLFHPGVFALGAVLAALGTALALGLAISLIYRVRPVGVRKTRHWQSAHNLCAGK